MYLNKSISSTVIQNLQYLQKKLYEHDFNKGILSGHAITVVFGILVVIGSYFLMNRRRIEAKRDEKQEDSRNIVVINLSELININNLKNKHIGIGKLIDQEFDKLKQENQKLQEKIEELQKQLIQLKNEKEMPQQNLPENYLKLLSSSKTTEQYSSPQNEELEQLKIKHEELIEKWDILSKESRILSGEKDQLSKELEKANTAISNLKIEIETSRLSDGENTINKTKITDLEKEINKLNNEIDNQSKILVDNKETIDTMNSQNQKLLEKEKISLESLKCLQEQNALLQKTKNQLGDDLEKSKKNSHLQLLEIIQLKSSIEDLKNKLENESTTNSEMKKFVEEQEKKIQNSNEQNNQQINEHLKAIQILKLENDDLKQKNLEYATFLQQIMNKVKGDEELQKKLEFDQEDGSPIEEK